MTDDLRALLKAQEAARAPILQAGHLCPWAFLADGRQRPSRAEAAETDPRVHEGREGGVYRRRLPWSNPPRVPTHGDPDHGAPRRPGTRREATDRAQDPLSFRL